MICFDLSKQRMLGLVLAKTLQSLLRCQARFEWQLLYSCTSNSFVRDEETNEDVFAPKQP